MADYFTLSDFTSLTESSAAGAASGYSTGDLRRRYNFGPDVSEFAIAQDPFFRFLNKVARKPCDDSQFKFTERRPSFHKRYAYVVDWKVTSFSPGDCSSAAQQNANATVTSTAIDAAGDTLYVQMATDYKSTGNISNVYGQTNTAFKVGAANTCPTFYFEDQLIKIPFHNNAAASAAADVFTVDDYVVGRIDEVVGTTTTAGYGVVLKLEIVRPVRSTSNVELAGWTSDVPLSAATAATLCAYGLHDRLEKARCYVVGNAHLQGSGYPETWADQPFSTGYGFTEIWKTTLAMDNTTRATVLKYEPNEWARIWREKLIEHKWDISQSCYWSTQASQSSYQYTQGAVDYIHYYGNVFSLTHETKTQDNFLDDLSEYLDPRYNNAMATLFFVNTKTFNWLHKLSGFFRNNLEISANLRADLGIIGKVKKFGVDITQISTPYGVMNVVRDIHLDGSQIKMLAINMKYVKYRPLIGNGLNRDTSIYVGVQTLANSGVDRRVDLIQTEAGLEWQMPEAHAYWA